MSKYQEALERLKTITSVASFAINEVVKELTETFEPLVKRATPMKVSHSMHGGIKCNKCYHYIPNTHANFCDRCGQAFDRSQE